MPWKAALLRQPTSPPHRMGQMRAVHVFVCVAQRTIEESLLSRSLRRWAALNFWTSCHETLTNSSEPSVAARRLPGPPKGANSPCGEQRETNAVGVS